MTPLKEALEALVQRLGLSMRAAGCQAVEIWEEVAGSQVASRSMAVRVADGVLYVDVDSPVWASQLTFMKADLLEKLNSRTGTEILHDIRFRSRSIRRTVAASSGGPESDLALAVRAARPSGDDGRTVEKIIRPGAGTGDDTLDAAMRRLVLTHLRVRRARVATGWATCPECGRIYEKREERCPVCAPSRAGGS